MIPQGKVCRARMTARQRTALLLYYSPNPMRWFRKPRLRFLGVYPLAVWAALSARTTATGLCWGILLIALGEAIRLWANGYVGAAKVNYSASDRGAKVGSLITGGPYAFVRHPLYLGTFLLGAGFFVIVGNLWIGLAGLGFFLFAYGRKMAQEEAVLRHEWGSEGERYQAMVPRWLPAGRRYDRRRGHWRWAGVRASKEWKTVIWAAVLVIALYLRAAWLQGRDGSAPPYGLKEWMLLAAGIALMTMDGLLELRRKSQRAAVT